MAAVERLFVYLSKAALIALMVLTSLNTFLRYFLNAPMTGVEAVSTDILMVMIVYFSISYCFAENGHIQITFIRDRFGERTKAALDVVFNFLALLFWALVSYRFFVNSMKDFHQGIQESIGFIVPSIIPNVIITLGVVVLCFRLLISMIKGMPLLSKGK